MTNIHNRICAFLLAALTFTMLLASCGDVGTSAPVVDSTPAEAETSEAETAETQPPYDVPEVEDYDGYEFRIAIRNTRNIDHFVVISAGLDGEVINDAVFTRNTKIEDIYNIKISDSAVDAADDTAGKIKTAVLAGDDYCDAAFYQASTHFTHAQEGYLIDVNTVDNFDFDQPYWDSGIIDGFGVYGKNYSFTGDITTADDLLVLIMLYNTKLYEDFGFEDPYQMITAGSWTFDRFWNMAKSASLDLNGDGVMDCDDQWGFISETSAWYYYSTGAGMMPLEKTADGGRRFVLDDEKTYSILEKTKQMVTDPGISFFANDGKVRIYNGFSSCWDGCEAMFMDDLGLFKSGCFNDVTRYRDMSADFGILPMPKYDEAQDFYCDLVTDHVDVGTLPVTVTDPERSALILSALSCESMLTLNPCFYDIFLDEKLARNDDSKAMIDLILDTKVYDLNWTAQISTLVSIIKDIATKRTDDFSSRWASAKDSADANLEKFLAKFAD